MATKLENLHLEIKHFLNFSDKLPDSNSWCKKTVQSLLNSGFLQVSTVFEHAIAHVGGHKVISEDAADIDDGTPGGSDAKLVSVRTYRYGKSYGAPVSNISGKTGTLRVQAYERKQDKFYYFCIPYDAYKHIPKTSNIEIPFDLEGNPKRKMSRPVIQNWWDYEVKSFDEMSK